jgi:peptidoglycan/LPS O-acetylase OafA/YrhL
MAAGNQVRGHTEWAAKLETMSSLKTKAAAAASGKTMLAAAVADVVLILAFAAIGRDAHHREEPILGVLLTAWPFLAGAAAGWAASRAWRRPLSVLHAGVPVWLGSLIVGMLLRALTAQTVVLPFVIVATVALAVFLVGYRLLLAVAVRLRSR